MPRSKGRTGRPYLRARDRLKRNQAPCHICGQPIDYNLHHLDPMSFQLDHIIPLKFGGDPISPTNTAASHRACNSKKGTKNTRDVVIIPTSRRW